MRIGQRLKRSDRFIIEVWEAVVVKHVVSSAYWRVADDDVEEEADDLYS